MADIFGFVKKIAPWLTAAATGNIPSLVTLAASAVGSITGKPVKDDPESISAAIAGATPEQIAAMRQADNDFALKMQALGFADVEALEKIAADDRASARAREETVKDKLPAVLAIFVTIGFFGALLFLCLHSIPDANHDAFMMLLGALGTAWTGIIAYYFGSSAGSAKKDSVIAKVGLADGK